MPVPQQRAHGYSGPKLSPRGSCPSQYPHPPHSGQSVGSGWSLIAATAHQEAQHRLNSVLLRTGHPCWHLLPAIGQVELCEMV